MISDSKKLAQMFNIYFNEITSSLDLFYWNKSFGPALTLEQISFKYKDHPSITNIQANSDQSSFSFKYVSLREVSDILSVLDCTKRTGGDIPVHLIKTTSEICSIYILQTV